MRASSSVTRPWYARQSRPWSQVAPPCTDAATWRALITSHRARYPDMALTDAFKLLQQATLGSEHAIRDPLDATRWMDREWASLGDGPAEPLVDTLGATGRYARVHLRPYRAAGGRPDVLVQAFVKTANVAAPDSARLSCAISALLAMSRDGKTPWPADSVATEAEAWSRRGYPAVEHSALYETRHAPAYRVVALELIPALLQSMVARQR